MLNFFRHTNVYCCGLIWLILCIHPVKSQNNIDSLLAETQHNFKKYKNLKCSGIVKVDIPNFRIPDTEVEFYFKQPDHFKHFSSNFTMLPKSRFILTILNNLTEIEHKLIDKINTDSLKMIELKIYSESLPDSTYLQIATRNHLLKKIRLIQQETLFKIDIKYNEHNKNNLPEQITYNFHLEKGIPEFSPPSIQRPFGETKLFNTIKDKEIDGNIKIKLTDYKINSHLIDTAFQSDSTHTKQ